VRLNSWAAGAAAAKMAEGVVAGVAAPMVVAWAVAGDRGDHESVDVEDDREAIYLGDS
jgi:adenine deaminase